MDKRFVFPLQQAPSSGLGFGLVRRVGAEHIIASTDCGFLTNPFPADCLAIMARQLRAQGISERELDLMFKENPARLLGLQPWREIAVHGSVSR